MKSQQVKKIKSKLPHGSYTMISSMMLGDKKYKPRTIEAMFCGRRTMKQEVLDTAKKFLDTINVSY